MTPDDLRTVVSSWAQLRGQRAVLLAALTRVFEVTEPRSIDPRKRAAWLLAAVDELVGLLPAPSSLAAQARALGSTWPDPRTAPTFAVEGRAWLQAAENCTPAWCEQTAAAWKQAWLLLSDVLAAEALSPFADDPIADHPSFASRGSSGEGPVPMMPVSRIRA